MFGQIFTLFVFFRLFLLSWCQHFNEERLLCADGLSSVRIKDLCDYVQDCNDASDEMNFSLCKIMGNHRSHCENRNEVRCLRNHFGPYYDNSCTSILNACHLGPECLSVEDLLMCQEIANGKLRRSNLNIYQQKPDSLLNQQTFQGVMQFISESLIETKSRNFSECPPFFNPFNKQKCVSLFTPVQVTWSESQLFCESITGSLSVLDDVTTFNELLHFIHKAGMRSRFWVGAIYGPGIFPSETGLIRSQSSGLKEKIWTWIDGKPVTMRAPFWSLYTDGTNAETNRCQDYPRKMMPRYSNTENTCLAMLYDNHYFFSDELCNSKLSPLCMTNRLHK
ncbi:UNVERIFIED_CONTAM: hypothetical protein RMT77_017065 [Armadillidium vulgare]